MTPPGLPCCLPGPLSGCPGRRRGRCARGPARGVRAYVAVPSRQRPLIVASWDRAVLRYLADSVLSVPPGAGPAVSMVLTVGLRMFRYPASWLLAAVFRIGGVVLVGRPE